ncbi:MAG TPA: WYL domain-containing protein [Terracidiphilus sp.]|jgi:predicted DNA-binding transcriptional regulator YafY|nr:WYL domain-containing protein [Terracidiphilus sp.]
MKADRLLSVLLLLQAKGRVTERELAERLEVSQRTIHRDLEALSATRVPVVALRGAQGGWELEKSWRTHVPGLDEAELRAFLMAQPRVVGHPKLVAAAESALNKMVAALPGPMRAQALAIRERLHVDATGWRASGEDLSMLSLVQEAVARERKLAFDYTRADGQKARRTVDPLGLVAKGLSWYLVALSTNGMRTFRVSRMEAVTALAVGFERPAHFDLAAYWARSTTELERQRKSYPAILSLTAEGAHRLRAWCTTKPARGSASDKQREDRTILQADFETEGQARFVVLGLGSQVLVAAPNELRNWVREETKRMARESSIRNKKEWAQGI